MIRRVILHGWLLEEFGGPFSLDISTPIEAVRALCFMVKGFRQKLRNGSYRLVRGNEKDGFEYDLDTLPMRLGGSRELHIVPVIAGAGNNHGVGKIIAGVALIAAAVLAPYALGVAGATFAIGGISITGAAFAVGTSLALSGIAQLLAPAIQSSDGQPQNASFLIGGQTNVSSQGGPVPLVYGQFRTGSVVISAGLTAEAYTGTGGGWGVDHGPLT